MIELELVAVRVELPMNTPQVVLRERSGRGRQLRIFIGNTEATAIAFALEGVDTPRPLTHDLFCDVLDGLGVALERVVITALRDTTYFADLHLKGSDDVTIVSSRPSDAIALAVRAGCPIFADEELLEDAAFVDDADADPDVDPDEVVEEFRHFIDNVSPDDFAS